MKLSEVKPGDKIRIQWGNSTTLARVINKNDHSIYLSVWIIHFFGLFPITTHKEVVTHDSYYFDNCELLNP